MRAGENNAINWEEHSQALREYLAKGLSFAEIARAINARFNTAYSRNATIGRARRIGLAGPERSDGPAAPKPPANPPGEASQDARKLMRHNSRPNRGGFPTRGRLQLRCVGIVPRHLSLLELEPGDCRYPYGGDAEGEAITFCGHPRREGSSYCVSHFHLTRGPGTAPERTAGKSCCGWWRRHERQQARIDVSRRMKRLSRASSHGASAGADPAAPAGSIRGDRLAALLRDAMAPRPRY